MNGPHLSGQLHCQMQWNRLRHTIGHLLFILLACLSERGEAQESTKPDWSASGLHGSVVAGGQGAVDAGLATLKSGGNAADAAVATILALSVTDARSFCFGGEVPILIYDARRSVVEVISGQGVAPRLATRESFAHLDGGIPARGILPAAVPGALGACITTLDRYGTRTFSQVVEPTLALLDQGKEPWHPDLARTLRRLVDAEKAAGADRPRGLRLVGDYFYRGPIAHEIDAWAKDNGGLLRFSDLATHTTRIEEPFSVTYHGFSVFKCGPWTQGPALLEALMVLDRYDLKAMVHNQAAVVHTMAEALKLAFADRDTYYGDPLFVDVPMAKLLSRRYADTRKTLIDSEHASVELRPGDPHSGNPLLANPQLPEGPGTQGRDTTTCLVADSDGNVVAATPSGWSGVLVGKTGIWLGTRLQSFNLLEGHPDCIEPGKRPRITLSPTLVLKNGKPVAAVSVAGGDNQDQVTLQLLVNHIDFGLEPAEAVTAPRFLTDHFIGSFRQKRPELGSLKVYPDFGEQTITQLKAMGHRVTVGTPPMSAAPTMLTIDKSRLIKGAGDPKARRHAAAY